MGILKATIYFVFSIVLYSAMYGLNVIFKKKGILYNPPKTAFEREQIPWSTFLAAGIVALAWSAIAWGAAAYQKISIEYPEMFIAKAAGEAVGFIVVGWLISLPFRYGYRRLTAKKEGVG